MAEHNVEDTFEALRELFRTEYPDAKLKFSSRVYDGHAEFLVYVLSKDKYDAIHGHCKALARKYEEQPYPIWVFARNWTGPWPGGRSARQLKKERDEFLRQLKKDLASETQATR
jgi:hypothetical protein